MLKQLTLCNDTILKYRVHHHFFLYYHFLVKNDRIVYLCLKSVNYKSIGINIVGSGFKEKVLFRNFNYILKHHSNHIKESLNTLQEYCYF